MFPILIASYESSSAMPLGEQGFRQLHYLKFNALRETSDVFEHISAHRLD
jgi:hypothetical protein